MPVIIAKDEVREPLYAVVPVFNPWRWKSKSKHLVRTLKHLHDAGMTIILVEAAFNRREFVYADSGLDGTSTNCGKLLADDKRFKHRYVPLRTKDELWIKEAMITVGVQNIPDPAWQNMGWFDGDVHFARPNISSEIIQALQHFAFLQPFTQARDLAPNYEMMPADYPHADGIGFIHAWKEGFLQSDIEAQVAAKSGKSHPKLDPHEDSSGGYYGELAREKRVFPGLVMCCTRQGYDDVGGLFEQAIWGGGDWHMSHALIGKSEGMMRNDLHPHYKQMVMEWFNRCESHVRQNVGCLAGAIFHYWHGKKSQRGYNAKHSLLAKIGFDPLKHLKKDANGLWQLHDDGSPAFIQLRDLMRKIALERNEDSIDV